MRHLSVLHRYLDPGETLAEVLFGLIMALTFIAGAELFSAQTQLDTHALVAASLGCNSGEVDALAFIAR